MSEKYIINITSISITALPKKKKKKKRKKEKKESIFKAQDETMSVHEQVLKWVPFQV